MKKIFYLLIILFSTTFFSCKKENDNKEEETTREFKGIQYVNENGEEIGGGDTTDWKLNDVFSQEEMNLFKPYLEKDSISFNTKSKGIGDEYGNCGLLFYPNPLKDVAILRFIPQVQSIGFSYQYVIFVDTKFNKLVVHNNQPAYNLCFNLSKINNGIYRCYYVFANSNKQIIGKGHGDIEIKR